MNNGVGASFVSKGENEIEVRLRLEGRTVGKGETLSKAAKAALDKVKDPEARELLIVIMDKCIV